MTSPGTTTVDVVVFGAGAGGMTAALVCALHGLDVLLCEKSGQVGGTTATSAGTIWVPGTRQARDAGMNDTIADASRYLGAIIGAAAFMISLPFQDGQRLPVLDDPRIGCR